MQEQAWDELLRRIPIELHDGLIFATVTGAEVILQNVIHIDGNFLIMRGRTAGTSDAGRLIMLPLDKINYLSIPAKLSDAQIHSMFGEDAQQFATMMEKEDSEDGGDSKYDEDYDDQSQQHDDDDEPEVEPARQQPPSKSLLLAKLRARLAGEGSKSS